jgi:hypothetical protein
MPITPSSAAKTRARHARSTLAGLDRGFTAERHGDRLKAMSDESIAARIETLVAEEHELRGREEADSKDAALLEEDHQRLRTIEVELDRCWDLLRQRRALRHAGRDPDEAHVRDASTVERYLQ